MTIKVPKNKLFYNYLTWLNPMINLTEPERKILSAFLTLHYNHKEYKPEVLNELLFSKDTQKFIQKNVKLQNSQYKKAFESLKQKQLILDNSLSPKITEYPKDNKFKISITFEVQ